MTLLKGPQSLIAHEDIWVNPTGSAHLATAGTGDVLAGMVGGCWQLVSAAPRPQRWPHGPWTCR